MTYIELQRILLKHPYLHMLIEKEPLETLQIKFKDFKDFDLDEVTKLYFVGNAIRPWIMHTSGIKDAIKIFGRPRYIIHKKGGVITLYRYRSRAYTVLPKLHVYEDPCTKKKRIFEDVKLLGTARVSERTQEGAFLRGMCALQDGSKSQFTFFVRHMDFSNPEDSYLAKAKFFRGHWKYV